MLEAMLNEISPDFCDVCRVCQCFSDLFFFLCRLFVFVFSKQKHPPAAKNGWADMLDAVSRITYVDDTRSVYIDLYPCHLTSNRGGRGG